MKNQNKIFAEAVNLLMGTEKPKRKPSRRTASKRIKAFDQGKVDELMLWTDNDEGIYTLKIEVHETLLEDKDNYNERDAMDAFIPIAEYASEMTDWDIDEDDIKQTARELTKEFESDNEITASVKSSRRTKTSKRKSLKARPSKKSTSKKPRRKYVKSGYSTK